MELNDYQEAASTTAIYREKIDDENALLNYALLGLVGEAGELANTWKKYYRDGLDLDDVIDKLGTELGDVLWYVSQLAIELGFDLEFLAQANLSKLADRQKRNVISGSGDNR